MRRANYMLRVQHAACDAAACSLRAAYFMVHAAVCEIIRPKQTTHTDCQAARQQGVTQGNYCYCPEPTYHRLCAHRTIHSHAT